MNVAQLKKFCAGLPGATSRLYEPPSNVLVYAVDGRWFAYFKTSAPERWRFSVRVTSEQFVWLTDVPGMKPARYRGRYGWITIVDVKRVQPQFLRALVQGSYDRALRGLSKRRRAELTVPRSEP